MLCGTKQTLIELLCSFRSNCVHINTIAIPLATAVPLVERKHP